MEAYGGFKSVCSNRPLNVFSGAGGELNMCKLECYMDLILYPGICNFILQYLLQLQLMFISITD